MYGATHDENTWRTTDGYSQESEISWHVVGVNKATHVLSLIYAFFHHAALVIVRESEECYS